MAAYMAAIFALSSMTNPPALPSGRDKHLHALLYAGLSVLLVRALADARWSKVTWRAALFAILVAAAYGISDEWHQAFVPGRQSDPLDVVADTVGAAVAAIAIRCVALWQRPEAGR